MEFMDLCPRIWIFQKKERDEMQVLVFKSCFYSQAVSAKLCKKWFELCFPLGLWERSSEKSISGQNTYEAHLF